MAPFPLFVYPRWYEVLHLCCTAYKKMSFRLFFFTNLRLEAPLPVYFSCTTFRHSATTSATLLIPKCTTRRWTLRCSNYSVAKRQQLPCALSKGLDLIFPALHPSNIFTAVRARVYEYESWHFLFSRVCAGKKQA